MYPTSAPPTGPYGYYQPGRSWPSGLLAPAICLVVVGGLGLLSYCLLMIGGAQAVQDDAGTGQGGDIALYIFCLVGVLEGALTLAAGVLMLRGRIRGFAVAGAIVSIVPASLCCVGGLPFGIWALVVLNRADVRAWFQRGSGGQRYY